MRREAIDERRLQDARILIIDDQEPNVRLVERSLGRAGYRRVRGMTDAAAAIETILASPPDLVLLDLRMPDLDGFGVLRRLCELGTPSGYMPVIVLTADMDPSARREALSLGADDFLTKPFDVEELLLRCRNLLETRFLHADIEEQRGALTPASEMA